MSLFSIADILADGRQSLKNENYFAALTVALMLPRMCWSITQRSGFENDWYKEYLRRSHETQDDDLGYVFYNDFPNNLQQLRRSIFPPFRCINVTSFLIGNPYSTDVLDKRYVNVEKLCIAIFDSVGNWISEVENHYKLPQNAYYDAHNMLDMEIYKQINHISE